METIVVTGATGFIGRRLCHEIIDRGYDCVGLSRASKSAEAHIRVVSKYEDYDPPDNAILVHLAERRDIKTAQSGGYSYVDETVALCYNLTKKAWRHVIYASSAEVYGHGITTERSTSEQVLPHNLYAKTKRACEQEILNNKGTALRLANVYGPGMAEYNVISDILKQIPGSGPLTVRDTQPMRDFIWIGDVIEAFLAALDRLKDGIFNVGTGTGTSIGDLARKILDLAGEADRPIESKTLPGQKSCIVVDVAETKKLLDWVPKTSLNKGLKMLLENRHG
ncbi:NAD(P)-dependent oxidoreductase [bacterium]|nr:NAD(P)-dependent oxidoreductase [bacterium]MBU1652958.1 NAD(P)-dependent oxidoreductase [bacterium]MBU1881272.1 NAD(P)-dependent oxidoreductase [bacterium]